jgi:hypothetical protein
LDQSNRKYRLTAVLLEAAHDCVMALATDQAALVAVMCAAMHVIDKARCQLPTPADGVQVDPAVEIDPLATIVGQSLAAKCFADSLRENRTFEISEMIARHTSCEFG